MRPKKRVLVFDENEIVLEIRGLILHTWGYAVRLAHTNAELERVVEARWADVVIAVLPARPHIPSLLNALDAGSRVLTLDLKENPPHGVGNVSLASTAAPIEIKEALRILAMHKRGPKKAGSERELEREAMRARVS